MAEKNLNSYRTMPKKICIEAMKKRFKNLGAYFETANFRHWQGLRKLCKKYKNLSEVPNDIIDLRNMTVVEDKGTIRNLKTLRFGSDKNQKIYRNNIKRLRSKGQKVNHSTFNKPKYGKKVQKDVSSDALHTKQIPTIDRKLSPKKKPLFETVESSTVQQISKLKKLANNIHCTSSVDCDKSTLNIIKINARNKGKTSDNECKTLILNKGRTQIDKRLITCFVSLPILKGTHLNIPSPKSKKIEMELPVDTISTFKLDQSDSIEGKHKNSIYRGHENVSSTDTKTRLKKVCNSVKDITVEHSKIFQKELKSSNRHANPKGLPLDIISTKHFT